MVLSKIIAVLPGLPLVLAQATSVAPLQGASQPAPTGPAYVGGRPDAFQRGQKQGALPDEHTDPDPEMQRMLCAERNDPAIGPSMEPPARGTPPCPPSGR